MDKSHVLPLWKKVLFGLLTLSMFFLCTELVLNVLGMQPLSLTEDPFVGYTGSSPLFVEQEKPDGTIMLATAGNKLGYFNYQQFPRQKAAESYRIFCLGGSTTYGHPYDDATSFCGWLREFLPAADPSRNWEVINAGGISYASYRVAALMQELVRYQPDLFIVYTGQNEFLEERTYRTVRNMPFWIKRAKAALWSSRIYSVMSRTLKPAAKGLPERGTSGPELGSEVREILNNTIGPTSYIRDDSLKREVIDHYRFNLGRMASLAGSVGSTILYVNPASNMKDMPPFKSEHRSGLTDTEREQWDSFYRKGTERLEQGRPADALVQFARARELDDRYAELHFQTGKAYFALRRFTEASASFQRSIDEDICPLRILTPMTQALVETAAELPVPLVDFKRIIEEDSAKRFGHRIPGREYFLDHVHPTIDVYRMLGLSLLEKLISQGVVRPGPQWNGEAIAAATARVEQRMDRKKQAYALIVLGKTLDWAGRLDEGHRLIQEAARLLKDNSYNVLDTLANASARRGKTAEAITYYRKALQFNPDDASLHFSLAFYLHEMGKYDEALKHYARAVDNTTGETVQKEQNRVNAEHNMALIYARQGRTKDAQVHYAKVLRLRPDHAAAHMGLGVLFAKEGREAEAITHLTAAVKLDPESAKAHYNLGMILDRQGKYDEAVREYADVLRLEPDSDAVHNNLGVVLAKQGKFDQAAFQFSAVIMRNPDNADAHHNLGMILARQGNAAEAQAHLSRAEKIRAAAARTSRTSGN